MGSEKELILLVDPEDTDKQILDALTFYEDGLGGIYTDDICWRDIAKKEGSTKRIKLTLIIENI